MQPSPCRRLEAPFASCHQALHLQGSKHVQSNDKSLVLAEMIYICAFAAPTLFDMYVPCSGLLSMGSTCRIVPMTLIGKSAQPSKADLHNVAARKWLQSLAIVHARQLELRPLGAYVGRGLTSVEPINDAACLCGTENPANLRACALEIWGRLRRPTIHFGSTLRWHACQRRCGS